MLSLAAGPAAADTIYRIDFQPNASFVGRAPVDFTGVESQASAADSAFGSDGVNTWNYLTLAPDPTYTANPSFNNLVTSLGAASAVGISFTGSLGSADDVPIDNSGSDGLENDYLVFDAGNASSSLTYTISGLPDSTAVTLYLYAPNFSSPRGYSLSVNGTSVNVLNSANAIVTVDTSASGTIAGTLDNLGHEGDFSGLQIDVSSSSAVPEPATWLFCGGGLLALALCWRRAGSGGPKRI
jgi:hypothetical protein